MVLKDDSGEAAATTTTVRPSRKGPGGKVARDGKSRNQDEEDIRARSRSSDRQQRRGHRNRSRGSRRERRRRTRSSSNFSISSDASSSSLSAGRRDRHRKRVQRKLSSHRRSKKRIRSSNSRHRRRRRDDGDDDRKRRKERKKERRRGRRDTSFGNESESSDSSSGGGERSSRVGRRRRREDRGRSDNRGAGHQDGVTFVDVDAKRSPRFCGDAPTAAGGASKERGQIDSNSDERSRVDLDSFANREAEAERQRQLAERARRMVPMSQSQYESAQSVIREIYDPETGRTRLVRGTGEIIERIVSREEHGLINRIATAGDGAGFARGVAAAASGLRRGMRR